MTASIARYLKDFGEPQPAAPVIAPEFDISGMTEDFDFPVPEIEEEPKIDVEALRAEAHAEGYEAAKAELQKQWDEDKQRLESAYAAELAELRARHDNELAQKLEEGLNAVAGRIAAIVSEQTVGVLVPILDEALANKAVEELAALIRSATLEGEIGTVVVSGPTEMFAKLQTALGAETPMLRHVESTDLDLSVDIDGSVLVTRLSAWSASLRKLIG